MATAAGEARPAAAQGSGAIAQASASPEDAALKKNTDCVYFLASPLTCKKGDECEFRHSEAARINPRDCWYWPSGSCLNRDCSFRHPPLDVRPVNNRSRTPCYFYSQGYCAKGDRCPFSHGVPVATPKSTALLEQEGLKTEAETPSKPAAAAQKPVVDIQLQTAAAVAVPDAKPVPSQAVKSTAAPGKTAAPQQIARSPDITRPPAANGNGKAAERVLVKPEESPEPASSTHEDVPIPDSRLENGARDPEERWEESSPGFDVLVDDGPEHGHYGDDAEFHEDNENAREHFEEDYEFEYPEMYNQGGGFEPGHLYQHGGYDRVQYDDGRFERGEYTDYDANSYDDRMDFDRSEHLDRDHSKATREVRTTSIKDRLRFNHREARPFLENGDLRNLLDRRRRMDIYSGSEDRLAREFVDRERYPDGRARSRERNRLPHQGPRRSRERSSDHLHHRLYSSETFMYRGESDHRSVKDPSPPTYETRDFGRRAEVSDFAAPKTLAQIRAEKRKLDGDDSMVASKRRYSSRESRFRTDSAVNGGEQFESPKPLHEILKGKRRSDPSQQGLTNEVQVHESETMARAAFADTAPVNGVADHVYDEQVSSRTDNRENVFDDDDDDDDDFAKKLGGYFS